MLNGADVPAARAQQTLNIISGLPLARTGPGYTLTRLAEAMHGPELHCRVYAPITFAPARGLPFELHTSGGPGPIALDRLLYRVARTGIERRNEEKLLTAVRSVDGPAVVYTFSEVSLRLSETLHKAGVKVVREKTNCGKRVARDILQRAYDGLGVPARHGITEQTVAKEDAELRIADAIFCPSPMVAASLVEIGLPPERLIQTSYGWDPARFEGDARALDPSEGVTVLFAGYVCVGKGAHILLEAWRKANIKGRLVLAGAVESVIAERYADVLARPDVLVLGFRDDLPALCRSSDWFIFPSLAEGGPLVTYEAACTGLPGIVSRMGAGAFVRHGVDGVIIDSQDPEVWAAEIASLPTREEERRAFGASCRARAQEFTWAKVGARRRSDILQLFERAKAS